MNMSPIAILEGPKGMSDLPRLLFHCIQNSSSSRSWNVFWNRSAIQKIYCKYVGEWRILLYKLYTSDVKSL